MTPHRIASSARRHALCLAACAAVSVLATGCGGGDEETTATAAAAPAAATKVTLTGVAATGAPISGAVLRAVNAAGAVATATTAADGSFSVSVSDGAPYALSVSDAAGKVWYSYAAQAGVANVTPLTTLALLKANANRPLAALVDGWGSARPDASSVLAAATTLNANFQSLLRANGVDYSTFNVFSSAFAANHGGLDALLDGLRVQISCTASSCTEQITGPAGNTVVTWNASASTAGISLSFTGAGGTTTTTAVNVNLGACKAAAAGTWSLLVDTAVDGLGGVAIPQVCIDGLPAAPASQTEFCSGSDYQAQLPAGVQIISCSFAGNVGTYNVRITQPLVLNYSVKYTFVKR